MLAEILTKQRGLCISIQEHTKFLGSGFTGAVPVSPQAFFLCAWFLLSDKDGAM